MHFKYIWSLILGSLASYSHAYYLNQISSLPTVIFPEVYTSRSDVSHSLYHKSLVHSKTSKIKSASSIQSTSQTSHKQSSNKSLSLKYRSQSYKTSNPSTKKSSSQRSSRYQEYENLIKSLKALKYHKLSIDGHAHNDKTQMNIAHSLFKRQMSARYTDNTDTPIKQPQYPNSRLISNVICDLDGPIPPSKSGITPIVTFMGQFIDHDLALTIADDKDTNKIAIQNNDPQFPNKKRRYILFKRSTAYHSKDKLRQHMNEIPGWIDLTTVYGFTEERSKKLRLGSKGKLKSSQDKQNLLPRDPTSKNPTHFLAGQPRTNQNIALICMQTLWFRQHNRICDIIDKLDTQHRLDNEERYHIARNLNIALFQKIVVYDWLPAIVGKDIWNKYIGDYKGHDKLVDSTINTQFSTVFFRFGHSLLIDQHPQINEQGIVKQVLLLRNMFERSDIMNNERMNLMFRGLASVSAKQKNRQIVDDVRNFLILQGKVDENLDLAALNIQRGRDHGVTGYNQMRNDFGLTKYLNFTSMTDPKTAYLLQSVYGKQKDIDPWIGLLCEKPIRGAVLGELAAHVVAKQFAFLRDGDNYWFENYFSKELIDFVKNTKMSDVIKRNTNIKQMQEDVFHLPNYHPY